MSKPFALLLSCGLLACSALRAQDASDKISVPLDDPARPVRVHASLMTGGIVVRGADVKNVTVETRAQDGREGRESRHERRESSSKSAGMKRLDLPGNSGLDIVEQDNLVTIKSTPWNHSGNLIITVPHRSSLQLKCLNNGDIEVEQVEGEIDVNDLNGSITLKNVSGSVLAHSLNGSVLVTLDRIDSSKPMSFSTLNGDIDVTLPGSLKSDILMKTDHGEIYSDFEVKLTNAGNRPTEAGRRQDGAYHLRFDHALRGTINGGGPEFQFTSFNGQIYLRKKK